MASTSLPSLALLSRVCIYWSLCLFAALFSVPLAGAQAVDLVKDPVDSTSRSVLAGHYPSWASTGHDAGCVPDNLVLKNLTVVVARSPQQQKAFEKFLEDQQDPKSPEFHHWLTATEIGQRFGASAHDVAAIKDWLKSQSLQVDSVAKGGTRIHFSGSAAAVGRAFGSEMHYFRLNGDRLMSLSDEPKIPVALAPAIKAITGLFTVRNQPMHNRAPGYLRAPVGGPESRDDTGPDYSYSCSLGQCNYIMPGDFAEIYDINSVYSQSINGAGQTIAIIGRSRVYNVDVEQFQSFAGLPPNDPTVIIPTNGVDPGPPATNGGATPDQDEALLDVTRAGSVAPGATIDLVVSLPVAPQDGVNIAAEYVVESNPPIAQIMSISFGLCEAYATQSAVTTWDDIFSQGAGEGISIFVSSGDSGAAGGLPATVLNGTDGCAVQGELPPATQGPPSPNSICSSSYATCVGGTEFADSSNPGQYWTLSNSPTFESALGYIPEGAWNESQNGNGQFQVLGSGGGVSAFIATPTWQTGPGVPGTQGRYTPDVAFSASGHNGYVTCNAGAGVPCAIQNGIIFPFFPFSGTSAAAPDMAGIAALLNQKQSSAQGNLNPKLYQLAANPSNNIFHDVTVASSGVTSCDVTVPSMCNNSTPSPGALTGGLVGYLVGAGYDEVTGLGSIDVANLLANWGDTSPTTTTLLSSANTIYSGASITLTASVSNSGSTAPGGIVTFSSGSTTLGSASLASGTATVMVSSLITPGQYPITAAYGGDANNTASTSTALTETVNPATFTFTASPSIQTISSGSAASYTLTVTPNGSYASQIGFVCAFSPSSGATCAANPVTPNATAATTTLTITGAPGAAMMRAQDHRTPPLYGWLPIGAAGFLILRRKSKPAHNRSRKPRRMGGAALAGVLVMTALTMFGCSSSSIPKVQSQTYTVTITATAPATSSGSSAAVTTTQIVTLTVQ